MNIYINTYGTYLHVKDELFEIRVKKDGEYQKHHYAAKKLNNIIITTGAALSTDAVELANNHNVDILFLDRMGRPISRIWHSKFGSTSKIRKAQLKLSLSDKGLDYARRWVLGKIDNQLALVRDLKKHRRPQKEFLDEKIMRMEELRASVETLDLEKDFDPGATIRGLEGTTGRLYFETLSHVLLPQYKFNGRSSRPAEDQFNAFLNYAYGIMYGRIERVLLIAGLDPYIGFLHRDDYNQTSFIFDFIEPYRIYCETVVFRLFTGKKVKKDHTDELGNGGYSLNKEGKQLLIEAFSKHFEQDKIRYKNRNQTRENALQMDAHEFANQIIKLNI